MTAEKEGVSIYDVMNRLVEQSPAGAKGLVFLPRNYVKRYHQVPRMESGGIFSCYVFGRLCLSC